MQSKGMKSTKFKVTDFDYFAKEGAALHGLGMSQDDILSTGGVMTNTLDAATGMNQMRQVFQNLATSKATPDRVKVLTKLKVKLDQIDMVGETPLQALEAVYAALDKVSEQDQRAYKAILFEKANVGTADQIMAERAKIAEVKAGLSDSSEFESDFKTMSTGRNAADARQKIRIQQQDAARGSYTNLVRQSIEADSKEKGDSAFQTWGKKVMYDVPTWFGVKPEHAAPPGALRACKRSWRPE